MLGIVILNYNTPTDTIECVKSIMGNTQIHFKLYIVDNNSTDNSIELFRENFKNNQLIEVIFSEVNGGYSYGNNLGIKKALNDGCDSILISNSDVLYTKNAIDIMYEKYVSEKNNIGMIGPKVLLQNGKTQDMIRKNITFFNYIMSKRFFRFFDFFGYNKKTYFKKYNYEEDLIFRGFLSGCCLLLGKEYFDLNGLLDEGIFLYYEEAIIGYNLNKKGLDSCLVVDSIVIHKSSKSIGRKQSAFSRFHRYYSSMYFLRKYKKTGILPFSIIFLTNYVPFLFNSIFKKEYRNFLKQFTSKSLKLFKNKKYL